VVLNYVKANWNSGTSNGIDIHQIDSGDHISGSTTMTQVEASDNTASGITIDSDGAVTFNTVTANHNAVNNALIHNAYTVGKAYNVSITNGTFNEAQSNTAGEGYGVRIYSYGNVTLNNITAMSNHNIGVKIGDVTEVFRANNVSITNKGGKYNNFSVNLNTGLDVFSTNLTVNYVTASNNGGSGIGVYVIGNPTFNHVVANSNFLTGILVECQGAAVGTDLTTSNNAQDGIRIDNRYDSTRPVKPITLTGVTSSHNGSRGLWLSSNGQITLTNVIADTNNEGNALLSIENAPHSNGGVTIKTSGSFRNSFGNSSSGYGVFIPQAFGPVSISNTDVNFNKVRGLDISLPKIGMATTLTNILIDGNWGGIYTQTQGPITITNCTVQNHTGNTSDGEFGAVLNNSGDPSKINYKVTLTNVTFDNNESFNLNITSNGSVTLTNVSASNSAEGYGVAINTMNGPNSSGVIVKATGSNWAYFHNNGDVNTENGLKIETRGAVVLSRISSRGNAGNGLSILCYPNNDGSVKIHKPVTINTAILNANGANGLTATVKGPITLVGVRAQGNTLDGAYLSLGPSEQNQTVTVKNSEFDDNGSFGLDVTGHGVITLTNVGANGNGDDGLKLQNPTHDAGTTPGVFITNPNHLTYNFDNNEGGVFILSAGEIKLINISASNPTGAGEDLFYLVNAPAEVAGKPIT